MLDCDTGLPACCLHVVSVSVWALISPNSCALSAFVRACTCVGLSEMNISTLCPTQHSECTLSSDGKRMDGWKRNGCKFGDRHSLPWSSETGLQDFIV